MLNIISKSIVSNHTRGPRKVVANLIAGLEEINFPYVINAALDATKMIWIHDDTEALIESMKLPNDVSIVVGPNVYTLPSEIPSEVDLSRIIWLHPSNWVKIFWEQSSSSPIPSQVWPVGINTEKFSPNLNNRKDLILIYNKQRTNEETEIVTKALDNYKEKYRVINYGNYKEADYKKLLDESKALIWIGRSESQGIGLLEALSMGVPILVWDIKQFGEWFGTGHNQFTKEQLAFPLATAIPYFDESCGIRFTEKEELDSSLSMFLSNLNKFSPRNYVKNHLSLAKQANEFLNIYKLHFGKSEDEMFDNTLLNKKKWKNDSHYFRLSTQIKDAIRSIIS